jgi:hypothetical protein
MHKRSSDVDSPLRADTRHSIITTWSKEILMASADVSHMSRCAVTAQTVTPR